MGSNRDSSKRSSVAARIVTSLRWRTRHLAIGWQQLSTESDTFMPGQVFPTHRQTQGEAATPLSQTGSVASCCAFLDKITIDKISPARIPDTGHFKCETVDWPDAEDRPAWQCDPTAVNRHCSFPSSLIHAYLPYLS